MNVEASLSSWLKPSLRQSSTQPFGRSIHHDKTLGDRPILGMVAAHWNENETSHVSPKWWDGNGIPNSTHKYKEDQKVSWHATPFEERLEKALSEESLVSQRKRMSGSPISFNETEESDTALSQLHNGNQSHHS
nr:protein JASON [Ipomoea batatas]